MGEAFMTDPERAAQLAAEFDSIGPPAWGTDGWRADLDRWLAELEAFFRSAERQQWYEETRGPYRPLGVALPSPHGPDEQAPPPEHFARGVAARLRLLPVALFRAVLVELAADFGRAMAEESEETSWQA
jgi:hypothetical protein